MTQQHVWTVNTMAYGEIKLDLNPGDRLTVDLLCIADSFEDAVEWLVKVRLGGRGKYHGGTVIENGEIYLIAASNAITGVVSTYSIMKDTVYKADKWNVVSEQHDTLQDAVAAILKRVDWPIKDRIIAVVDDKPGTSPEEWEAAKGSSPTE